MKKVKEWLNELPEEYREKAIGYLDAGEFYNGDISAHNLKEAICIAFIWTLTAEGYWYWDNVYCGL